MADLRVDYQLLASITRTLSSLAGEFEHVDDQVGSYDPVYGSGAVTSAMGNFSGNWSGHRKTMLTAMGNLGHLTIAGFEEILELRAPMNRGGKRRRCDEELIATLRSWESSEAIRRAPSLKPADEDMVQTS